MQIPHCTNNEHKTAHYFLSDNWAIIGRHDSRLLDRFYTEKSDDRERDRGAAGLILQQKLLQNGATQKKYKSKQNRGEVGG